MIRNGEGFGLYSHGSCLVTMGLTDPYGDPFAWISMVWVKKKWRQRGIATDLIHHCLDYLRIRILTPILDATDTDRAVHSQLEFDEIYALQRLESSNSKRMPQNSGLVPMQRSSPWNPLISRRFSCETKSGLAPTGNWFWATC